MLDLTDVAYPLLCAYSPKEADHAYLTRVANLLYLSWAVLRHRGILNMLMTRCSLVSFDRIWTGHPNNHMVYMLRQHYFCLTFSPTP